MKRVLTYLLIMTLAFTMCACRTDLAGNLAQPETEPSTVTQPQPIQIIAPFDIYEADPQAAGNVQMMIHEGYKLIQDMGTDEYPYCHSYNLHTGAYGFIAIVPILLEADMQNCSMSYKAKTNLSGFFTSSFDYIGKEAAHERYFYWRGENAMPEQIRDTEKPEHIWVDILIKADDHIVGFAVLEIVPWDMFVSEYSYTIEDRYTEYYTLIGGQFQEVDEDFVWQRIEQYHKYAQ